MQPLTQRKRKMSLLILVTLFVVFAPLILLYSLGYRLGSGLTLQKTGGIFVHSTVANASVYLDDEYVKDSGIFLRNTLIQDLTPDREYKIAIYKEGYQGWVKNIFVYPSIVSEGRVILLPEKYELREIFKYLDSNNVATSTSPTRMPAKPNNLKYVAIQNLFVSSTPEVEVVTSVLGSVSTSTPVEQKSDLQLFFEALDITDFEDLPNLIIEGKEVSWLSEGNIRLYWRDDVSSIPYYYCGGLKRVCENKIELDWEDSIKRFAYFPGRSDIWITLVENGIYAVEVDGRTQRNIQKIYEGSDLDFRLTGSGQLIIQENDTFFETDL